MKKNGKSVKWCVMFVLVFAAGILYSCRLPDSEKAVMQDGREEEIIETENTSFGENTAGAKIYVYVSGCVKKPGVYQLLAGSRIYQAVEAAGGMTKKADTQGCNLAEALQDGQQIHIPSKTDTGEQTKDKIKDKSNNTDSSIIEENEKTKSTKININTASKEELMTLTGIGEVKAQAIIHYRQSQGAFSQIRDLMKVEGIKEGSYSKIQDDICVE